MREFIKIIATIAVAGLLGVAAPSLASATPTGFRPAVVGGTKVTSGQASIVQLVVSRSDGYMACTALAISSEWILTAKHCVKNINFARVHYSHDPNNRGTAQRVDNWYESTAGDVALVHLESPHALSSYAQLASSYTPKVGDRGVISGFGNRANGVSSDGLYSATVQVTGGTRDSFGGNAVHVNGISGATNLGDSGGPLVINGKIVAIASTADRDPRADIHGGANYANLTAHRAWITQLTGI